MTHAGDGWALHVGDCLAGPLGARGLGTLDDRSIDVSITDPPYEQEAHTKGRRVTKRRAKASSGYDREVAYMPLPFEAITERQRTLVALHLARVTRRWILVFCQVEATTAWRGALELGGAEYIRTGIWNKPDGQPQFTGDRPGQGYEAIVIAHAARSKGEKLRWNGGGRVGVFEHSKGSYPLGTNGQAAKPHPTTKPLPLMLELVGLFSDQGEQVLDPFAGSGRTGIACRQLGRRFLGWEISPEYADTAARSLRGEAAVLRDDQPSLFAALTPTTAPTALTEVA